MLFSWELAILGNAERALYDIRYSAFAEERGQDQDVQLLVYDDQTVVETGKRTPLDRQVLVDALRVLDTMEVQAIGIDFVLQQQQPEDDELVEVLRSMQTPTFLAYSEEREEDNPLTYEQQEFHNEFFARLDGGNTLPANAYLEDDLGVVRRWPASEQHEVIPLLSSALAESRGPGQIYGNGAVAFPRPVSLEEPVLSAIRIDLLGIPEMHEFLAPQLQGKYVLIGSDISDFERFRTPLISSTAQDLSGTEIHGVMLAQALQGNFAPKPSRWLILFLSLGILLVVIVTTVAEFGSVLGTLLVVGQATAAVALPFALQYAGVDTVGVPAFGWLAGWLVAYIALASLMRATGARERSFAQGALGKYLPEDIAQEIIDDPERLNLSGSRHRLYVLFSDLEGFTKLSEQLEPEQVATLLNDYLDKLSSVVLDHGGVVDKYVGDAVVAFWGAPIAREDDARRCVEAGLAVWKAGERFRRMADPDLPAIGRTRVGLHCGYAVVGNFGGERRIQYTALGDTMNTAARLEAANKALGTSVIASKELAEESGFAFWRDLGKVLLRGRSSAIEVCEPVPDMPAERRDAINRALANLSSDRAQAITVLSELATADEADHALQLLVGRLQHCDEEGGYPLD